MSAVRHLLERAANEIPHAEAPEFFRTLAKVLTNLLSDPSELKFRNLKLSNKVIQRVFNRPVAKQVLVAIGFELTPEAFVFPPDATFDEVAVALEGLEELLPLWGSQDTAPSTSAPAATSAASIAATSSSAVAAAVAATPSAAPSSSAAAAAAAPAASSSASSSAAAAAAAAGQPTFSSYSSSSPSSDAAAAAATAASTAAAAAAAAAATASPSSPSPAAATTTTAAAAAATTSAVKKRPSANAFARRQTEESKLRASAELSLQELRRAQAAKFKEHDFKRAFEGVSDEGAAPASGTLSAQNPAEQATSSSSSSVPDWVPEWARSSIALAQGAASNGGQSGSLATYLPSWAQPSNSASKPTEGDSPKLAATEGSARTFRL